MYKSKVWLYKSVEDLERNNGDFWIDYTFMDKPETGQILNVTPDMTEDLQENYVWTEEYGNGNYMIQSVKEMFDPKINAGFSFGVMLLKVK